MTYPKDPGFKEKGGTSEEAATKMKSRAETLRDRVMAAFRAIGPEGATADEVATLIGKTELAVRPRVTELFNAGKLEKTELRRKNVSKLNARVWRVPVLKSAAELEAEGVRLHREGHTVVILHESQVHLAVDAQMPFLRVGSPLS